jgi:putative endonuclease
MTVVGCLGYCALWTEPKNIRRPTSWPADIAAHCIRGVTSDLWTRVANHKNGSFPGFTTKHEVQLLVRFEHHHFMDAAIKRETQIKGWKRQWKIEMIERQNPDWIDLHDDIDFRWFDPENPRG